MKNIRHVIFDAYGTLFDLSGALAPAVDELGNNADAVLARWRILQLEYSWLAGLGRQYVDFEVITRNAFVDALAEKGITNHSLTDVLLDGFRRVSAYPDAKQTLGTLRDKGCKTAILSNGSPAILASATSSAGLDDHLDRILSVDAVKTYKPSPDVYALATSAFGIDASDAMFVSSNWWDAVGADSFGYNAVWVDRGTYTWPPSQDKPKTIVNSLAQLAGLIG